MKNISDKFYYNSPIGIIEFSVKNNTLFYLSLCQSKVTPNKSDTKFSKIVKKQLDEYFSGKRKTFNLKIELNCTPFQKDVLDKIIQIPYGKTLTYSEIASGIGNKNASRAIGLACKTNPILIIIPCHRVISKNGLGGYVAGLEKKKYLLNLENKLNVPFFPS